MVNTDYIELFLNQLIQAMDSLKVRKTSHKKKSFLKKYIIILLIKHLFHQAIISS